MQTGLAENCNVTFKDYSYEGSIKCTLSKRSGLRLSWDNDRGISIVPFTSFMVTNILDSQMLEGVKYKLEGTNVGLYHQTIDPREPLINKKFDSVCLDITYLKNGIKMYICGIGNNGFKIMIELFLSSQELYSLLDFCNDLFSKRLQEISNA